MYNRLLYEVGGLIVEGRWCYCRRLEDLLMEVDTLIVGGWKTYYGRLILWAHSLWVGENMARGQI